MVSATVIERNRKILDRLIRGDMSVSDLINDGGYLNPEQLDRFIEKVYDARPSLIGEIRREQMTSPKREINKIGISGNFLHKAPGEMTPLQTSQRTKATTGKITLTTEELVGTMYLPYKVLEDNIARGTMEDTIMEVLLPRKVNRDLNKLIIQGDLASPDDLLSTFNGIFKLCTLHKLVFDATSGDIEKKGNLVWSSMLKAMPYQFREVDTDSRYWINPLASDAYSDWTAARTTAAGDQALLAAHMAELSYRGIPLRKEPYMFETKGVLTNPQNIILGIQREMQYETDRAIEERAIIIAFSMRAALGVEETDAVVTAEGLVTNEMTES